jgi:septal ring factor EnvC (AmiA/AmiB activator)
MENEIKFSQDEMKQISQLQSTYAELQNALGQLSINQIRLEQQLDDLESAEENVRNQYIENQTKEREFVDSINKKYGDGNLNLETGVFTPKPTTETPDKTL